MPERQTVLLIDDEPAARTPIALFLEDQGFEVLEADSAEEALKLLATETPDAIISDIKFEGMSGIELLERVKETQPDLPVVLMTAYGTIEDAVRAMKLGAETYLTKPVNYDELLLILEKALERKRLKDEVKRLRQELASHRRLGRLIGASPKMLRVFETITQVATSNATVLIYGESGTGKELVAEAIHQLSPRSDGPFVKLNCAVFTETLLESELFGHEKGAFTGAIQQRKGRFELAHGGTLFLDDIVVIPHATQVKLLRFLQEHEFERVGGNKTIKVDVRIIAATNEPLEKAVREGRFREDLYYRLNVVPIVLPPLRERKSDIPLLVNHFIAKHAKELGRPQVKAVAPEVLDALLQYHWPGNVRELENWVQRAIVMCQEEVITLQHMPPLGPIDTQVSVPQHPQEPENLQPTPKPQSLLAGKKLKDIEREAILETLKLCGGSTSKAAKMLGISVRKIQYKLKEYREQGLLKD